jgi:hypothetical protein
MSMMMMWRRPYPHACEVFDRDLVSVLSELLIMKTDLGRTMWVGRGCMSGEAVIRRGGRW